MLGSRVRRLAAIFIMVALSGLAHAAPPIETYGRLPGFERAAMSPSGDRVAMIGVAGEQRRLVVVDRAKKVLVSSEIGNSKLRGLSWAGEDKVLIQTSATVGLGYGFTTSKAELSAMIVVPLTGKNPWIVFQSNRNITGGIRGFYGAIERGGRWYGYFGGITLAEGSFGNARLGSTKAELYEVDLENGKATRIARRADGETIRRDWVIAGDGSVAASMDFMSNDGSWTIRDRSRRPLASGKAPTGDVDLVGLGRTEGTILYYTREDSEVGRLFEVPLAGGEPVEVIADDSSSRTLFDEHRRLLIGYTRDSDIPEDHFFDERYEKRIAAARKAFPGRTVQLIDANAAFDRVIVRTDGPGDPQSWWVIDMNSRQAEQLGLSYAMHGEDVGPMRMIRYKAADGLEIGGVLTLPPGRAAKNLPVVILPHGGPQMRDYPTFDWWAQAYASRGYAVLQPNFRGSTGMGDAFRVAGYGEWGRKMQTDLSDGVRWLAAEGVVDPARVCIVGGSYGGYAAMAGLTLDKSVYRCGVSVAGVSDLRRMVNWEAQQEGERNGQAVRYWNRFMGAARLNDRALDALSPALLAEAVDSPLLLIHGKDDTVVPIEQSRVMAEALRRAGKPVELIELAGEDHWMSRAETRQRMLRETVRFLEASNPVGPMQTAP